MPLSAADFAKLPPEAQATLRAGLLMEQLLSDSDAAKKIIPLADTLAKKRNPGHLTIEDQAAPIVERVRQEFEAKFAERDKKDAERLATEALQARITARKQKDGFTDEGVANVLKIMQERGVADFDVAADSYLRNNPAPPPAPGTTDRLDWNFYHEINSGNEKSFFDGSKVNAPAMIEDPEKWERATALAYLNGQVGLPE